MDPVNLLEYEPLARQKLSESAYGFIAGAAEDEVTLRENRAAFQRLWLRPRVLVDVSRIDPSTTVLGQRIEFPVLLAPIAVQRLAHPDGALASARVSPRRSYGAVPVCCAIITTNRNMTMIAPA